MRYKAIILLSCFFTMTFCSAQVMDSIKAFYSFSGNSENGLGTGLDDFQSIGSPLLVEDRFGNTDCAYEFTGDSLNYFSIPNPTSNIDVNYMSGWSISLWYQGGSSEIGDLEPIFTQGTSSFICNRISIYDLNKPLVEVFDFNTNNYPHVVWADDDTSNLNYYMDSTLWHHVVVSVEPNNYINLYVDNVLQSESLINTNVFDYCGSPISLGKLFKGKIDDLIIYHKALSNAEVDTLFNMPSFCSQIPLHVQEHESTNQVILYPNPVASILNIESDQMVESYTLIDALGRIIKRGAVQNYSSQIDVSQIPNGIYVLNLDSKSPKTYKISVIH